MTENRIPSTTPFIVSSPLWKRAPSRDASGKPYYDFMMLIPGLKKMDQVGLENIMLRLKTSLRAFENVVVYVDLNTRLNLLWVTIKPIPHISPHIMQAIQFEIPEARIVAGDFNQESMAHKKSLPLLAQLKRKVKRSLRFKRLV